jgi:hypothetical protein
MKTESIVVVRRKPREQYGHEEVTVSATLEQGEVLLPSIISLRAQIEKGLNADAWVDDEIVGKFADEVLKDVPREAKPPKAAKVKPAPEVKAEEPAEEAKEEPKEEVKDTKAEVAAAVAAGKSVKVKAKATPYDRTSDLHKKLVSEMLDAGAPGWKAKAVKARSASEKLNGTPFLDSEGCVTPEFRAAFLKEVN